MKRVLAKSADNGWAETARMAESCANDIDCFPPRKSSAERRMRGPSPKLRGDGAGEGSLISPEPVGADSKEGQLLPPLLCFVARWMLSISGCATSLQVDRHRWYLILRDLMHCLPMWLKDYAQPAKDGRAGQMKR